MCLKINLIGKNAVNKHTPSMRVARSGLLALAVLDFLTRSGELKFRLAKYAVHNNLL